MGDSFVVNVINSVGLKRSLEIVGALRPKMGARIKYKNEN